MLADALPLVVLLLALLPVVALDPVVVFDCDPVWSLGFDPTLADAPADVPGWPVTWMVSPTCVRSLSMFPARTCVAPAWSVRVYVPVIGDPLKHPWSVLPDAAAPAGPWVVVLDMSPGVVACGMVDCDPGFCCAGTVPLFGFCVVSGDCVAGEDCVVDGDCVVAPD
jgi:hypothetical protein